jgi:abequosyltransferase
MNIDSNIIKLSICIPTNGRVEILKKTLSSYYNSNVNIQDTEIIIYDSSTDDTLCKCIHEEFDYPNLKYIKGDDDGFLNLINVLYYGNGLFLKLHNDYTMFNNESVNHIVKLINKHKENKPVIFYSNGVLKQENHLSIVKTFNEFLYITSFYNSWSTSFGIWKSDFDALSNIKINPLFPHNSFLFSLTEKNSYIIDNSIYFENQIVTKKGGYNLFYTFAVIYNKMIENLLLQNKITKSTFNHIRKDLYKNFLIQWYCNTKLFKNEYNYELTDIKASIKIYYSSIQFYNLVFSAYLKAIPYYIKLIKSFITK